MVDSESALTRATEHRGCTDARHGLFSKKMLPKDRHCLEIGKASRAEVMSGALFPMGTLVEGRRAVFCIDILIAIL